jgi:hypothetical protein
MKKILFTIFLLQLFVSGNIFAQKMDMPYKADYSSDFQIGSSANSKKILQLWKDFDDNMLDRHISYFADTVVMFFPDGSMVKGKDSALASAKSYRGSMSSCVSTISAYIPLKSVDKNENWVAIWGTSTETFSDGKTQKEDLQEIWRINKDGKVDFMKQFASKVKAN